MFAKLLNIADLFSHVFAELDVLNKLDTKPAGVALTAFLPRFVSDPENMFVDPIPCILISFYV
jgi:hypothetical protein